MNDVDTGLIEMAQVWSDLERRIGAIMDTDSVSDKIFSNRIHLSLGKMISTIIPFFEKTQNLDDFARILGCKPDKVSEKAKLKGLEYLKTAADGSESFENLDKAKSYLTLAKYYREFLNDPQHQGGFIESLLTSMKLGNFEARQLFCCILTMPDFVNDENFLGEIKRVLEDIPAWMFLMCTNQMLAALDTEMYPFVNDILFRIAKEYPNAIRFAYRLSAEKYKFDSVHGKKVQQFANRLRNVLSDPLYERFIHAMHCVGPANLMLKHYLGKILEISERIVKTENEMEEMFDQLFRHLYTDQKDVTKGPMFKVVDSLKQRIEALRKMERGEEFDKELKSILKHVSENSPKAQKAFLKSYTTWLSEFQCLHYDSTLEIPGQYDGLNKPNLKYHVTISSFQYDVMKLESKSKPLRITILGNDAKEYKFLIKFGEDLRQDQRIQQFFRHVNYNLRENKQTKNFSIDTYNVIPLSSKLGMIQWIDHASSLGELIKVTYGEGFLQKSHETRSEHLFALSRKENSNPIICHLLGYEIMNRNDAISRFNQSTRAFPWDLLRKAFWKLSSCPEHFVFLRSNFAVSQGVAYAAHWLMGIGDRHLQNTLVSTKTGRILGIDFGCAFGYATQFL